VVIIPTQARDVTFGDVLIAYIIGLFWTDAAIRNGGPLEVDVADVTHLELARFVADVLTTAAAVPAIADETEDKS
jgi:hypothetical protein